MKLITIEDHNFNLQFEHSSISTAKKKGIGKQIKNIKLKREVKRELILHCESKISTNYTGTHLI